MKFFSIKYIKNSEHNIEVIGADSKIEAIKIFKQKPIGIFVSIQEVQEPFSMKFERLKSFIQEKTKSRKVNLLSYISSLRQISVMLDAGININSTLTSTIKSTDDKKLKEIFADILERLESGAGFSKSMQKYQEELGNLSVAMVDLGEKTGMLSDSIGKLADILQEIHDNRVKLKKATRYPIITIFAMIIAFVIVIVMVVPQFSSIFSEYKTALPFPTRLLIWVEKSIINYWIYISSGAISIFVIFSYLYKKTYKFHLFADKTMLKIYIVGQVVYLSMIGRFIYIFDRLTQSGIPVIEALKTAISIVDNEYLKSRLLTITDRIEEGNSLTNSFKDTEQFESMVLQMLEAGESSGALNAMLSKISAYYKAKYVNLVDNVSMLIEPILIAGIAGFVLLLALGIFLPMWSLADAVGG